METTCYQYPKTFKQNSCDFHDHDLLSKQAHGLTAPGKTLSLLIDKAIERLCINALPLLNCCLFLAVIKSQKSQFCLSHYWPVLVFGLFSISAFLQDPLESPHDKILFLIVAVSP